MGAELEIKVSRDKAIIDGVPVNYRQFGGYLSERLTLHDKIKLASIDGDAVVFQEVSRVIRAVLSNVKNRAMFSDRWKRNIDKNKNRAMWEVERNGRGGVVILASGPSVLIKKYQGVVLSLPSTLKALHEAKIEPYGVVTVDGGYWAKDHLRYLPESAVIFAALRAALPGSIKNRVVPFSVSDEESAMMNIPRLEDGPSVISQAIQVANKFFDSPRIHVSGLDLASFDVHQHIRPHTFDYQNYQGGRLSGCQNILYNKFIKSVPEKIGSGVYTTAMTRFFREHAPAFHQCDDTAGVAPVIRRKHA